MGKRIRAQRKGSSPRYRVASHRFPGEARMPRENDIEVEVVELVHSQIHTAPLARIKLLMAVHNLSLQQKVYPLVVKSTLATMLNFDQEM